ncbi:DHHC palmitoyltransferase-domain-containing protein [Suillus paluster]|uniref:DHHC palmitoyltransferase-domain-containing protein n=1 Tax=Suillus paluster TaxID=48578 RepID=UPI001B86AF35|nr:DHHC palmitoyltransferase-domain-containing protein [Suillus paluster]KAG1756430.1 DHHC palmitoyltransferase-domain-containing protein [Suillus paluster]
MSSNTPKKHRPAHLPLPSSNFSAAPVQRFQDSAQALQRSASLGSKAGKLHSRSISNAASLKPGFSVPAYRDYPLTSPATVTTFQLPPIPSTTHAGGILPSSSFFRPSRPVHSRPSSSLSFVSNDILPTFNSAPPDQHPLSNTLTTHLSHESDLRSYGDPASLRDTNRQLSKRLKQSREPLLPLNNKHIVPSASAPSRTSMHLDPSNKITSANRMRNSFERVFRGLSLDTLRKSTSSLGHTLSPRLSYADEHPSFPHNGSVDNLSPPPHPRRKFSPSPPLIHIASRQRIYQRHPSQNRFFCGGRLLTGGDSPWAFIASLTLVFGLSGVWFGTTCVWYWHNESPAVAAVGAYMSLLTASCMLTTACRDPGILPRNLDPDPPFPPRSPSDDAARQPMPRDLKVRNDSVRVKYCSTCKTYRPPRSSHCKMCDNCVDGCDHHCQWVNNCIGRRNYTFFFAFLVSAVLTLCLVICTSALHLYLLTRRDGVNFSGALEDGAGSAVAFSLAITVIWPVTALLVYHMRLLLLNITTIEQIRNQAHKTLVPGPAPPNPFSYGSWRHNLMEVLCRPAGFSWLDAHAPITEDKRRINPGLEDARPGWEETDIRRAAE